MLSSPTANDEPTGAHQGSGNVVHTDNTTRVHHRAGNHGNAAHDDGNNSSVNPVSNGQNASKRTLTSDMATLAMCANTSTVQAATVDITQSSSDTCTASPSAVGPLVDCGAPYSAFSMV